MQNNIYFHRFYPEIFISVEQELKKWCMNQHDQYNDDKYDSHDHLDDDQDHHDQRMTNLMTTNTALTIVMMTMTAMTITLTTTTMCP